MQPRTQSVPLVSVLLPTYQRPKLLPRAIRSVVAQTFNDWELIIVDDSSAGWTISKRTRALTSFTAACTWLVPGQPGGFPTSSDRVIYYI
mgnify:CR=1 FL=1